jgi:hypothetical protein
MERRSDQHHSGLQGLRPSDAGKQQENTQQRGNTHESSKDASNDGLPDHHSIHIVSSWCCYLTLRLPSPVPKRGQDAELLREAQHVSFDQLFHNLATHHPVDVGAGSGRFFPGRGDTLEGTGVLEPKRIVDSYHVALCNEKL